MLKKTRKYTLYNYSTCRQFKHSVIFLQRLQGGGIPPPLA